MRRLHLALITVLLAGTGLLSSLLRAETAAPASGIVVQVRGSVGVAHGPSDILRPAPENALLAAGDVIETAQKSGGVLVLPNGSTVFLQEQTRLVLTQVRQAPFTAPDLVVFDHLKAEPSVSVTALDLEFGEVVVQVRKLLPESAFSIRTPVGPAGSAGAAFVLAYTEDENRAAALLLGTANGLVRFTPVDGKPVEVSVHRQAEVRARVGRTGVQVEQLQIRALEEDAVDRIEDLNRTAREDVNQALQRARAMRRAPQPPDDHSLRPAPPRDLTRDNRPEPPKRPARPVRPAGN
ncbi:MAG: FecR domain-containing protein [Opitutae bacterium]|nr:FecR domain-containing protein [Opitutae bacterium]